MADEMTRPRGEGEVKWVSTDWLQTHLSDKDLSLVDCQPDVHDYIQEHLPGAVYLNPNTFNAPHHGIPSLFVSDKVATELLHRAGLKLDRPVAVYTGQGAAKGWGDGLEQAMVAYALARFGHQAVLLVDGGLEKWKSESRRLVQELPVYKHTRVKARERDDFSVNYDEFRRLKDLEERVVFDARMPALYEGKGPWPKPGHIPGAVSLPWRSLMADDNPRLLRPEAELREISYRHNLTQGKTILCTGGTAREATLLFLVLRFFLGFPKVRVYEGSFTEWCAYPENPTASGPNPR
ncbi:MAG TPA: sulfurtransferase [Myxococcales bacterium]|nr:sulfurtransferase [Myxococcales bacterium]